MKLLLINVKYKGEIKLTDKALSNLKDFKKIALYTTTQFIHRIKEVEQQLTLNGNTIITSQPERTNSQYQVLGCDVYHKNLKLNEDVNAYLYIGDGKFHPRALMFATKSKVFQFNPIENTIQLLDHGELEPIYKKEKANYIKFLSSNVMGVLVTTKPGQEHIHYTKKLEEQFPEKQFYTFVSDTINFSEFENFPFIDVWINTACPRIALEDSLNSPKSLINVETVLKGLQ